MLKDVQSVVMTLLKELLESDLQQCFQAWHRYCNACVKSDMSIMKVTAFTERYSGFQ
jgi:hypothetical protein